MLDFIKGLGPSIFFCTVIIGFEILYHKKKSDSNSEKARRRFWDREAKANSVRKKDITYLNYIDIPLESLPMLNCDDDELNEYEELIKSLAGRKILNLSGQSNTDLKLAYGPANLPELISYDENYITLVGTIAKWGARLIELGYTDEAVTVLEYGISIGTDVGRNFYMLADIYRKNNQPESIDRLITTAGQLNSIMSKPIIAKLTQIRSYLK